MDFNEYQYQALKTAVYERDSHSLLYPTLGLVGEAGEVAEKVKKLWRNLGLTKGNQLTQVDKEEIGKELGDILWYAAVLADELGYDLSDIAVMNLEKLNDRKKRGVLKSKGDKR